MSSSPLGVAPAAPSSHHHPATAGIDTSTNIPVDGPGIATANYARIRAAGGDPIGTSSVARLHPGSSSTAALASTASALPASTPAALTSSGRSAPAPLASNIVTGTITGFVYQWRTGLPLQGVVVQAFSTGGAICPDVNCSAVTTVTNGSYTVNAPVGADYVQYLLPWNLTNLTYATAYAHMDTFVGITYLVPDAIGYGYVRANTTTKPTVTGVQACASSRDQLVNAQPCGVSDSTGYYKVAIPPMPSIVNFQPTPGYLPDFLFTNGTPHFPGDPLVNLGTIYLTHLVLVQIELYNSVGRSPVPTVSCPFTGCRAIQVCSLITNQCQLQGNSVGGSTVYAFAVPGPSYVKADASGFISNDAPIGNVSRLDPGKTFDGGHVYMVPMAAFDIKVGITTNSTSYTSMWSTGLWYATVQSMDGYLTSFPVTGIFGGTNMSESGTLTGGCVGIGSLAAISAFPGMNDVNTFPDYTPTCALTPTWPIPSYLPVWGNETYVNGTPDEATTSLSGGDGAAADWLNMTPGTYVYGHTCVTGFPATCNAPRNYTIIAQSDDATFYTSYGFQWAYVYQSGWKEASSAWACTGSPQTNDSWCVPTPPGDAKITVGSIDGLPNNFTWSFTHNICCVGFSEKKGMPLGVTTTTGDNYINFSAQGTVYGNVYRLGGNLGVSFGNVQVCTAGSRIIPGFTCTGSYVAANGSFASPAPMGWDKITATGSGYEPNYVWVYVTGRHQWVGNITLTPLGTIDGRVVDPQGNPLYEASVKTCLLASSAACSILGLGQTNTYGYYNGTILGGWLPWTTYEVIVTASGYSTDWTFINSTAGTAVTAPTLTLYPLGVSSSALPKAFAPAKPPAGVWVTGTVVDAVTGDGICAASVIATSVGGANVFQFTYGTNCLGNFNDSVLPGIYTIAISASGYQSITAQFNATLDPYIDLGRLTMDELPWVNGTAFVNPWGPNVTIKVGASTYLIQLGPYAGASGCDFNNANCGLSIPISSQGNFSVNAPNGKYNIVTLTPLGTAVASSLAGGVVKNNSIFNTSGYITHLNASVPLDAFASVAGFVMDNSSVNPETAASPWLPVKYAPVSISTTGPHHASVSWITNGGGFYDFFLYPGANASVITATNIPTYQNGNLTLHQQLGAGLSYWTNVSGNANISIGHFGFIDAFILDSVSNLGVPYIGASVIVIDGTNLSVYDSVSTTNGAGELNLSAMYTASAKVFIGNSQDYNATNFTTGVNESRSSFPGVVSPYAPDPLRVENLNPWGWFLSWAVNNSTGVVTPTVIDQVNGLPLPNALITVASSDPTVGSGSSSTNWQGQFLSDAPISPADSVTVTHYAYVNNVSLVGITAGQLLAKQTINMTGDGVIAGRVVGLPGYVPIQGAAVQVCAPKGACYTAATNSSGVFWILGAPGQDTVTASADGYVTNASAVTPASSCSDCWTWMGQIVLNQYAYLSGVIRGLPSGFTLGGAEAALCSPNGVPVGACGFTNTTAANGQFLLEAPSGTYVLQTGAIDYNTSYRPVALAPGQHATVGTVFLEQFGGLSGAVYSALTLSPVSGAQVYACAKWGGGDCAAAPPTDTTGTFAVRDAPGPYTVSVSAPGYADAYNSATIVSGTTATLSPILLVPLGTDTIYSVSGIVVNASNPSQGIGGATIALSVGASLAGAAPSDASGAFTVSVPYGTYVLQVSAHGYHPYSRTLVVTGTITGLTIPIAVMVYNVTGIVRDGLNGQPLAGVSIVEEYGSSLVPLATSGLDGSYSIALANGTHSLNASYGGALTIPYGWVSFSIVINGAPQQHDLSLYPSSVLVRGIVVNAITGLALPHATVLVAGSAADGYPVVRTVIADASGAFSINLPTGSYKANSTYTGYVPKAVNFTVAPPGAPVTLALAPLSNTEAPSPSDVMIGGLVPILAVLGLIGVGVVLAALWTMRRRPAKPATGAGKAKKATPPASPPPSGGAP